jgi:hypothetical protein
MQHLFGDDMDKTHFQAIEEFIQWVLGDGYNVLQAALVGKSENVDDIERAFREDIDTINAYGPFERESREQVCFYARLARKKGLNAPLPSEEALAALMSARPYEALHPKHHPRPTTDS